MILVIDNYDSFTFNLVQYLGELGAEANVVRNDQISLDEIESLKPDKILISPGPGSPDAAGISCAVVERFASVMPIFGVCLGHQCIGQAFGGKIVRAERLMHGKTSEIHHHGTGLLAGMPNPFNATRYHSLLVDSNTLPKELDVTADTRDGEIMGLRHRVHPVEGVQFHPESILTQEGKRIVRNFLDW